MPEGVSNMNKQLSLAAVSTAASGAACVSSVWAQASGEFEVRSAVWPNPLWATGQSVSFRTIRRRVTRPCDVPLRARTWRPAYELAQCPILLVSA